MFNLTNVLLILPAAGALHYGYRYMQSYLEAERIRKLENTEEPPREPNQGLFGLNAYREASKYKEQKIVLAKNIERYEKLGDTYVTDMFGRTYIDTRDPENIKAILSTQFEQFSLGDDRHASFFPFFGDGIFTHVYGGGPKGELWRHSRAMLRPQFAKQQIQDLAKVEEFVQRLLARIPSNETCDLQELFFRFTLDTCQSFKPLSISSNLGY